MGKHFTMAQTGRYNHWKSGLARPRRPRIRFLL